MKVSSIRNQDGIWINTSLFKEEGNHFMKNGYYCSDPWGSPTWFDYWKEQRRRCIEGYSIGGVKITGDHYFYLNFCPIEKVGDISGKKSKKVSGFPDFWDGDFNYFWVRDIARNGVIESLISKEEIDKKNIDVEDQELASDLYKKLFLEVKISKPDLLGGRNLIVGKSRRKGYSYKNASIAVRHYFTNPNALVILGAYDKKYLYPNGIFSMADDYIGFINSNTAWAMPSQVINKPAAGHKKASYKQKKNGIEIEKGFKSEIISLTFNDNPDAARGKDAVEVFFEESGKFGSIGLLKKSYAATQDCVMAGAIKTGMITLFGTSGDMEAGSVDFADMYFRPQAFDLLSMEDVWTEGSDENKIKVGFFHPVNWNMEGYYDKEGNSNIEGAKQAEKLERKRLVESGATTTEIQNRMQEKPLNPHEAFGNASVNNFPVAELQKQKMKVVSEGLQEKKGMPVDLYFQGSEVIAKPILDKSVLPITSYKNIPKNKSGAVLIYEQPVPNPPKGLYKIGYDPIRHDTGTSLASIIVYKGVHKHSFTKNIIVAEYIGRRETPEDIDHIAEKLAIYYNTQIMIENEVPGSINYFKRKKKAYLLAVQPDKVISNNIKKSKVARIYGCHVNDKLKDAGERYIIEWLLTILDYDENGDPVRPIDYIYSIRLLEELISYNKKGNFDLVSALIMCMFQAQDEELEKVYDVNKENHKIKQYTKLLDKYLTR